MITRSEAGDLRSLVEMLESAAIDKHKALMNYETRKAQLACKLADLQREEKEPSPVVPLAPRPEVYNLPPLPKSLRDQEIKCDSAAEASLRGQKDQPPADRYDKDRDNPLF